ncbi:MAG TPA: hypothetical protein VL992_04840 [Tepidisphaeraceae bacterium]|nr:hypothetical protein [Tepidisphaeraceae bacterium]
MHDQFLYLVVYQRLRSSTTMVRQNGAAGAPAQPADDAGELKVIEKDEQEFIPFPTPTLSLFGEFDLGALRLGPHTGRTFNFFDPSKSQEGGQTLVDLDQIRIIPGGFFRRGEDDLCYYQGAMLPGKFVDVEVDALNQAMSRDTSSPSPLTIVSDRAAGKAKRISWDNFTARCLKGIRQMRQYQSTTQSSDAESLPLSDDSLRLLAKQMRRGQLKLVRDHAVIFLRLDLTQQDVQQARKCWSIVTAAFRDQLNEMVAAYSDDQLPGGLPPDVAARLLKIMDSITLTAPDAGTLQFSVDVLRFCSSASFRPTDDLPPLADDAAASAAETSKDASGVVKIDPSVSVQQLQADFLSGKLTSRR